MTGNLASALEMLRRRQLQVQLFHERFMGRKALLDIGVDDLVRAHALAGDFSHAADRRAYVRTFLAMVEGAIACMKETLLDSQQLLAEVMQLEISFTQAELAILREKRFNLTSSGQAKESRLTLVDVPSNLRFTFNMLPRVWERELLIDYEKSQEWREFCAAVDIRNRLAHPREVSAFEVSDADLRTIEVAQQFFKAASGGFYQAIRDEMVERGRTLERESEALQAELRRRRGDSDDGSPGSGFEVT